MELKFKLVVYYIMKYFHLFKTFKLKFFPNPNEAQQLLGRWKVYNSDKLKELNMSNSNKDNCFYNHKPDHKKTEIHLKNTKS